MSVQVVIVFICNNSLTVSLQGSKLVSAIFDHSNVLNYVADKHSDLGAATRKNSVKEAAEKFA